VISVLKCGNEHIATKKWTRNTEGALLKIGCDNPTWYKVHQRTVTGIHDLHSLLAMLENDPRACIIRGYPAPGVDVAESVRRMKYPDKDTNNKIWIEEREGQPWILVDLDKVPVPDGIDPITDPTASLEYLIANCLPPELRDVTCVWQWSSSTGMQGHGLLSAHFWFWLDRPMTGAGLKRWFLSNDWLRSHDNHIDMALFNEVQPHYTAAPVFEGVDNPIGQRTGLRKGSRDQAALSVIDSTHPMNVPFGRKNETNQLNPSDEFVDPISSAHGFDAKLKLFGDDGGKKRFGFHRPIIAAVAAFVHEQGSKFNREALKMQLRAAIKSAPKRADRQCDIENYCGDKHLDDAIQSAVEKFGRQADERLTTKAAIETAFFDRYLWVEKQEAFFDVKEYGLVSEKNVKFRHPEIGEPASSIYNAAYFYQTDTERRRFVHNATYWPGEKLLVTHDGMTLVNTWREHNFVTREGDASPYMGHLTRVFPDKKDQNLLLNKMAYAVQNRGKKPNWHLILFGSPGVGKDTLLKPMLDFFADNAWSIAADDLTKSFNGFVAHEQIVVQELHTKSGRDVLNRLKPWLAAPPDWINVDEKNKKPYQVRNLSSWWFTTNEPDAIKFDNSDRRFCILHSPLTAGDAMQMSKEGYFKRLYDWLGNGGCGEVINLLLNRKLPSDFDAQGQAPWTEAKGDMIAASLGSVGRYILQEIKDQSGVFAKDLVTVAEIAGNSKNYLPDADRKDLTTYRITEALKTAGAVPMTQIRIGGREGNRMRLWAVRDTDYWAAFSATDLKKAYENGTLTAEDVLFN
jgi:hypothetical protein